MTNLDEQLESKILDENALQNKAIRIIKDFNRFLKDKKLNGRIMLGIGLLGFLIFVYTIVRLVLFIGDLNAKTKFLLNLSNYDTRDLQTNQYTKDLFNKDGEISDILSLNKDSKSEIEKYENYITNLNTPYQYFLQYIYLPRLNIWKNIYTDQIDVDMIGKNFLEKNPYDDIFLLKKRSDFFKNVGDNNETNDIKNIKIGDISENSNEGLFYIPVSLAFESKSKRAFLLLVDKISITSNKITLSLINEFFYYLWQEIKSSKKLEIEQLKNIYSEEYFKGKTENLPDDKVIGLHIYNRIYYDKGNRLIDQSIIDKTIRKILYCEKEGSDSCYYKFREKYRDIASFAYLIGGTNPNSDPVQSFKNFILSLPPIFSVKQFNFNTSENNAEGDNNIRSNTKYKGNITIDIYGKGISQGEVDEISTKLGDVCYGKDGGGKALSVSVGLESVNKYIDSLSNIEKTDSSDSNNLRDLKKIIEKISEEYNGYTNYKKIVKLFEIYRMLKNIGLCK